MSDWLRPKLYQFLDINKTQSRWGLLSFLSSTSLFFISLSISFYALYLSVAVLTDWRAAMSLSYLCIVFAIGFLILGLALVVMSVMLWLYFRNHKVIEPEDEISNKLTGIETQLDGIARVVNQTRYETRRQRIDRRNKRNPVL